ncbi:hypothetical protein [Serratia marcescens]|uniref:hypothetical protein n=1 Tax=Serratia TaxID=613 RepID=UPI003BA1E51E
MIAAALRRAGRERRAGFLVDEFKRYTVDITTFLAFGEDVNVIERGENALSAGLREIFPVIHQRCRSPFRRLAAVLGCVRGALAIVEIKMALHAVYGRY